MFEKIPAAQPLVDLMEGCERWHIQIDEHGICDLVDVMPRLVPAGQTAEYAIKRAARTSTGGNAIKTEKEDRGLIRYLMRHRHTSPLEFVTFTFHHVLPIFVARQLIRHRMASVNETSLRYSEAKDRFWIPQPQQLRKQSTSNKQGGEEPMDLAQAEVFLTRLQDQNDRQVELYHDAMADGMSRELARIGLPVNLMTEWYWAVDLHNLLHFLGLRQDKHAQKEIRAYADAMYELIKPIVPIVIEAYDQYHPNRQALTLTSIEIGIINGTSGPLDVENLRELEEAVAKLKRLGLAAVARRVQDVVNAKKKGA